LDVWRIVIGGPKHLLEISDALSAPTPGSTSALNGLDRRRASLDLLRDGLVVHAFANADDHREGASC
jgi:hypothetical protein